MERIEAVAWNVVESLEKAGYEAYLVGGCVRDKLLNRTIDDYDITTSALPEEVQAVFAHTVPTGLKHGTVTVREDDCQFEVTTFRTDGEYEDGRRPAEVKFVRSLEEDLARRDLTINAMALGRDGTLHDPFGGQFDLLAKRIKAVGDPVQRFAEDALRMLRAIRFAAQLQFEIEEETLQAISEEAFRLQQVSRERIRDEWIKMLLTHSDTAIELLWETDTLRHIFSRPTSEPEPWERAAAWTADAPPDLALRFCLVFAALDIDEPRIDKTLQGLKLPSQLKKDIRDLLALQATEPSPDWPERTWRQLFYAHGYDTVRRRCLQHAVIHEPEKLPEWSARVEARRAVQPLWQLSDLALTGQDLIEHGINEGPALGHWLKRLAQAVLQDPAHNNREALLQLVQDWQRTP
ncbi:poly(A) polymerase/tRNA nucleotidyltransferase (CCA-adding enzyme) [Tumebacillus sp. BK434]|uniref:CCA tRNA nucleotidyltransferase n=1 Tax=Tumebacillus sp. BK434 TaxID=2512169 RepID=UPI00105181DB|nr:CCA tRNA nucleotidyltransferase [Tumebacillus sp. BK434]TCP58965.1 poly(A) polymerase/tRNA nucleotidyltransferase (CCA-adding enzyme) [Tumebacillus sp. BK434]